MTKPNRRALFFSLAISLLTHSAYGAPPSKATPNVSRKVAAAEKPAKKTIRAQSPDTVESEESFFDTKLIIPAGGNEVCIPATPLAPLEFNPQNAFSQPASQIPSLAAGQGSLTATSMVPSMIGDFFGGNGTFNTTVLGRATATNVQTFTSATDITYIQPYNGTGRILIKQNEQTTTSFYTPATTFESLDTANVINGGVGSPGDLNYRAKWSDTPGNDYFRIATLQDRPYLRALNVARVGQPNANDSSLLVHNGGVAVLANDPRPVVNRFTGLPDRVVTADERSTGSAPVNNPAYGDSLLIFNDYVVVPIYDIQIPAGALAGRTKVAENASPIPRDRIFVNYSYFNGVSLLPSGVDVNQVTPGFEKTFFDGAGSIEVRIPFATTLDANITVPSGPGGGGIASTKSVEFGDITTYGKLRLYSTDNSFLSGGLGVSVPTADDVRLTRDDGVSLMTINNNSVHVMPFLGAVQTPTSRLFFQQFVQVDVDVNGRTVTANLNPDKLDGFQNLGNHQIGTLQAPTFLYADANMGYWLYRSDNPYDSGLTGLTSMFELHYNRSLTPTDTIQTTLNYADTTTAANYNVGTRNDNIEVINATVGLTAEINYNNTFTAAYVLPIAGGVDKEFNGEFRIFYNHIFGPKNTRATIPGRSF